jgi:cell division protein FtsA
MSSKPRIIASVEIGTARVKVLVGEITTGSVAIIGLGECQSHGIAKGAVTDQRAASHAVHTALEIAQKNARIAIDEVFLAQTGRHLEGFPNEATINVSTSNNKVSPADIENACRLATSKNVPPDRTIVHEIRRPFRLDAQTLTDPLNITGRRLEASYWIVHGDTATVSNTIHIINGYNLKVKELIVSALSSGTMVATREDTHHGALVLDIGAGVTDYILYRHGSAHITGVVPVGGGHITNDLALGLRITEGQAEKIKHRFGNAQLTTRDKTEKAWLNGDLSIGDRQLPKHSIEQITSTRVWETLEIVRKKLGPEFTPETVPAGVVLTGGASKLAGIAEAAAKALEVPARTGEFPAEIHEQLRDPAYATPLGILHTAARATQQQIQRQPKRTLLDRLTGRR